MNSSLFWKLVRHEFTYFGNRRKSAKRLIKGKWWFAYFACLIVIGFVVFTLTSSHKGFYMENIWFFTTGLPYIIFFMGHGLVKKEWDNETQGWWLALPYSRTVLIGAKFFGSLLQSWTILLGVYVLATIYGLYITLIQSSYTFEDLLSFMMVGFNWVFLLVCISPLVVALGMTTAVTPYTVFRPIVPLLWFLFMFLGSFLYWGLGFFNSSDVFSQFVGLKDSAFFSYSIYNLVFVILCWIFSYLIIRLLGYLLNNKLSL